MASLVATAYPVLNLVSRPFATARAIALAVANGQ